MRCRFQIDLGPMPWDLVGRGTKSCDRVRCRSRKHWGNVRQQDDDELHLDDVDGLLRSLCDVTVVREQTLSL